MTHTSRAQTSRPCAANPIPPAAQIFLPLKRMAGVNTKEHTFPLCTACFSLHSKLLFNLPNAAASQTARDGIPCSPLCKCFGKNCTNSFTDDTQVDDEEEDDDALSV